MKLHKETLYNLLKAEEREAEANYKDDGILNKKQRDIIERYKKNKLVENALKGTPIIQSARWIESDKYKQWRLFIPHKKDINYNAEVNCLAELVNDEENSTHHMKTNGIFYPDNLVNVGAYVAAGAFMLAQTTAYALSHLTHNNQNIQTINLYVGIYAPSIMSFFGIWTGSWISSRKRINQETSEKIKYIDSRINKFFHK